MLRAFLRDDHGQDLLEYALLSALVGIVALLTVNVLRSNLGIAYTRWNTNVDALWEAPPPGS